MNWSKARLSELYCIAYDDPMATPADRRAAMEEILRRKQRRKKAQVQYKKKAVYPR